MNVASSDSSRQDKKVLRLFLAAQIVLFVPIVVASFFGCARTVETVTIHDTDTVVQHDTDTVKRDEGPAWVRFINFLTKGGVIVLKTELGTSIAPFANATQIMRNEFIPIHSDSSMVLYCEYYIGTEFRVDSITIPADSLKPLSLTTIVLFQVEQDGGETRISPFFANDSLRLQPAPSGKAYFRFINGVSDHPQPSPTVNVYLDDPLGKPVFLDQAGTSRPVSFLELRNYTTITAGLHNIFVRKDSDSTVLYTGQKIFRAGAYYTAKLLGSKTQGSDQFSVDEE